ncbi:MAG TPA: class I SAM-dependent methyltransferase [Steroidobacteraceae bacterium]|nr:class I SAM-dependent methyltransferase [Steroidobacteraceae bacterium]
MATTKMIARIERPAPQRPHERYKQDLFAEITAFAPASVLDVGCGTGELLRNCMRSGIARCVGIEPDAEAVAALKAEGLDARVGRAESLEFPALSFDVVVFDYVAHHVEHLELGLAEAMRVARRAVVVLDPWYDLSVESQRVAADFDLWLKRIDRRLAMVHDPSVTAAQLARPFNGRDEWRIDCRHRLILQPLPLREIEEQAKRRLAAAGPSRALEDALEILLDRARQHGLSDDGAILFVAIREAAKGESPWRN